MMKLNYDTGKIPTKYELVVGEVGYNVHDGRQYTKLIDDTIVEINHNPNAVPISSGADANGFYTKFPDGTLLCYVEGVVTNYSSAYNRAIEWIFPYPFKAGTSAVVSLTNTVIPKPGGLFTEAGNVILSSEAIDHTKVKLKAWTNNKWNNAAGEWAKVSAIAVGRWK